MADRNTGRNPWCPICFVIICPWCNNSPCRNGGVVVTDSGIVCVKCMSNVQKLMARGWTPKEIREGRDHYDRSN